MTAILNDLKERIPARRMMSVRIAGTFLIFTLFAYALFGSTYSL
jgi:hypothetical protein